MFRTKRSLRWAAWAALFLAVSCLAAAVTVPSALRDATPFTLLDPEKQFTDLVAYYSFGVVMGLLLFAKSMLGVVAVAAMAACAARLHPTRAALGGSLAAFGFLAHAARGIWIAAIEPAAAVRYSGGDLAVRQALLDFLQINLLFRHFFNWMYIFFAGLGFAFLAWALWPEARRLAAALWLAAAAHAVHFPATMYHYYSVHMRDRRLPLLGLLTETGVWLFPGLAFLLAAIWLKAMAEAEPASR